MNKKKILQCVFENAPISRAGIAGKINLSKPTVSALVDELIHEGWIFEKGIGESTAHGGRKPIQLYFNEKAAYVIGTDIGGTKVKTVISDLGGNIMASSSFQTGPDILKQLAKEIEKLIEKSGIEIGKILGMGAGVPGITDPKTGVVFEAPSLNWVRYPFLTEAKRYFSFPVYVDNDVNVAALGEQWLGNAKNKENVMYIAVGTGIGSGLIIQNQLYRGAANAAGEVGYTVTDKNAMKSDFKPVFHRYGFLESVAGGKAIGEKFAAVVGQKTDHPLHPKASVITGEDAFTYAKNGDPDAQDVIQEAIEHLAYGIVNAAAILNPEVIILGGGVMKSSEFILPKLREIVNQYLPSPVELRISQLGENTGVLGAVSLFLREHDSIINFS